MIFDFEHLSWGRSGGVWNGGSKGGFHLINMKIAMIVHLNEMKQRKKRMGIEHIVLGHNILYTK